MKSVVITGVSSGLGYGLTKELLGRSYRVFGSVRSEADADRVAAEMGENFTPLLFDVTDAEAVSRAAKEVETIVGEEGLSALINNVGIAITGPLRYQPLEEVRAHFETNVIGLVCTTQAFLPLLGATTPQGSLQRTPKTHPLGRIINLGSASGEVGTPFMAAYVGTKHALEGMSDSLRRELLPYEIDVILIRPGVVKTGQLDKALEGRVEAYKDTDYAETFAKFAEYGTSTTDKGYATEEVVRRIADVLEARNPKTRYTFIRQKLVDWTIPRLLSDRMFDQLIGRALGLLRKA